LEASYLLGMIEIKRHQDLLGSRLDELVYRGHTTIQRYELYAWYGRQRLTQGVFKHLLETYYEAAGGKRRVSVLVEEGSYLLVDAAWLQPANKAFDIEEE
jgi:hypothetical protein